jgi:hypothetical protein
VLGFLAGGLHLLSLLMLFASWWVYAAFAASLGLWFSLRCGTTLRATVYTLVTLVVASVAPLVCFGGCGIVLLEALAPDKMNGPNPVDGVAMTPPGAMVYLVFGWGKWYSFDPELRSSIGGVGVAWFGACGYAVAAAALWLATRARFGPITGRMSVGQVDTQ